MPLGVGTRGLSPSETIYARAEAAKEPERHTGALPTASQVLPSNPEGPGGSEPVSQEEPGLFSFYC